MAKVWRCDRWDVSSMLTLLTIIMWSAVSHAACWTDTWPVRIQSNPVVPTIVQYEWHIKSATGTTIRVTDENILSTSEFGLADSPIQVSVVQINDDGQRSPESPKSDFIFAYPPFGADLNGDGVVQQDKDYYGRPTQTGMSATFGCKSCAVAGQCPPENALSSSYTPYLLPD